MGWNKESSDRSSGRKRKRAATVESSAPCLASHFEEHCKMGRSLRQKWDTVNDCPDFRPDNEADKYAAWNRAVAVPIPAFRAKLVRLPHGQTEISVTSANSQSVINARMGFNPLLDCSRRVRDTVAQEERDVENRQRASKRARQNVRYLVKSLFADHMLTFSYRANVEDRARVAVDWKEFVRLFRVRYPDWSYLAVLEKQERGSFHIHVAVKGKQDIRWLLRCWLIAIGQSLEEVSEWLVGGLKLGERSMGAVNVEPPKKRWGGASRQWKRDKLSGYLTKYIGKEFEEADKFSKKYWHSRNVEKPVVERFWLKANTYLEAIEEAHDLIYYTGATSLSLWGSHAAGVVWITGETDREKIGQVSRGVPDFDFLID